MDVAPQVARNQVLVVLDQVELQLVVDNVVSAIYVARLQHRPGDYSAHDLESAHFCDIVFRASP